MLKPWKDPSAPKNFRKISLLTHTYELFELLILHIISPFVDNNIISEQAGFHPEKSTTSQVLKPTLYIEDGDEEGMVTALVFVDLSPAYDTLKHRHLLCKTLEAIQDTGVCLLPEKS